MSTVIKVENLSKQYRLGQVGTGTIRDDVKRWWASLRGKEDPFLKIGSVNDRTVKGEDGDYVWALRDMNFQVNQGEVLGIIGKNGAGKSTLLKILSKVTQPTTGSIKIKGRIASLLEVGTGFHPELSGRENVFQNGAILGMTKKEIKAKFDEIVAFSGVERYINTPVKRYSSGMYVRLAFAVAAHLEPEILIVDEVLAVGDADFQKKCLGKMKDVAGQGRTVLFVSHNLLAIKSLCSRGIWLDKGSEREMGDIKSVVNMYLSQSNQLLTSFVTIEKESHGFFVESVTISNNGVNGNFNITEDLIIDIKVTGKKYFESININLFFNTIEGISIFATCSPVEKFNQGSYCFQCVIPANTLNDNVYNIDLMVVESGPKVIHNLKEIMLIEGVEEKREGAWFGKYPGLIRPQNFKWNKIKSHE